MNDFKKLVFKNRDLISKLRQDLHRIPETAYTEEKTSRYVAAYLKSVGLEVKNGDCPNRCGGPFGGRQFRQDIDDPRRHGRS